MNIQENILGIFLDIQVDEVQKKLAAINLGNFIAKIIIAVLSIVCVVIEITNSGNRGFVFPALCMLFFAYIYTDIIVGIKNSQIHKNNFGIGEYLQVILKEKDFEVIMKATEKAQDFLEPPEENGGAYISLNNMIKELIVVEKTKLIPPELFIEEKSFYTGRYPYAAKFLLWTRENQKSKTKNERK